MHDLHAPVALHSDLADAGSARSAWRPPLRGILLLAAIVASAGCSSLPTNVDRPVTTAVTGTESTRLGQKALARCAAHPGLSGFFPLRTGMDALTARLLLIDAAEAGVDAQYYLFHDEPSGWIVLDALLAAAERGVAVRLLLDDLQGAELDPMLLAADAHPSFEVRMFNPLPHGSGRKAAMLTEFSRINRRMHNKSLTVDAQATIVGGRNIGDEYFSLREDLDYVDLDVLAIGPVVIDVTEVFDAYWNSESTYPLRTLADHADSPYASVADLRADLGERLVELRASAYADQARASPLLQPQEEDPFRWGRGVVVSDQPEKVLRPRDDESTHAAPVLREALESAREEVILSSPYFVPGTAGTRRLGDRAEDGVHVRILTNSLAANDVPAVHSGYARYRPTLLRRGVEIWELKAEPSRLTGPDLEHGASSSLHGKTFVFDRETVFIGSVNLDPRSLAINTEMGILFESPEIAREMAERFERMAPALAYRVERDEDGWMTWTTVENGVEVRHYTQPDVGLGDGVRQLMFGLMPIENQL